MSGKKDFEVELWKAQDALSEIKKIDVPLYRTLDCIIRLLGLFVDEIVDPQELERMYRRAKEASLREAGGRGEDGHQHEPISEEAAKRIADHQAKAYL